MSSSLVIPPALDVSAPVKRPLPARAILWPTMAGYGSSASGGSDATRFPQLTAIKARSGAANPEPLAEFKRAAGGAQDRVLVMDGYLFKPTETRLLRDRIARILEWFPPDLAASDVRLLTGSCEDETDITAQFNDIANDINSLRPRGAPQLQMQIQFTLGNQFPYVHDRYAVIDNELWHFGATVGGLHEQVNAATRGWDVDDHDALAFFELAWRGDNDLQLSRNK
jgi:hypothetical protein